MADPPPSPASLGLKQFWRIRFEFELVLHWQAKGYEHLRIAGIDSLNPKSFFLPIQHWGECFHPPPPPSVKLDPDILESKTYRTDSLYYVLQNMQIWNLHSNKWRNNDVITKKQWQNWDLRETKQIVYHSKGIYES